MRSRNKITSLGTAILLSALFLGGSLSSSAQTPSPWPENPERPGIPVGPGGPSYVQPRATSLTEANAAKQWLRIPALQTIGIIPPAVQLPADPTCRRSAYSRGSHFTGEIYAVSPTGSPEPFGYIGPHTVRTAAFGSIPVEATIVISQSRDDRNIPIPIRYSQTQVTYCAHTSPFPALPGRDSPYVGWTESFMSGPVRIQIEQLKVDGVQINFSEKCRTRQPSVLSLGGPSVHNSDPSLRPGIDFYQWPDDIDALMETRTYHGMFGGLVSGTIDISDFTGCTTSDGDDISALLSASISGPSNAIEVRSEGLTGPPSETACAWTASCEPLPNMPFPRPSQ